MPLDSAPKQGGLPLIYYVATSSVARKLFDAVVTELIRLGTDVSTGTFGAEMQVHSVNDGPFTVLIELQ